MTLSKSLKGFCKFYEFLHYLKIRHNETQQQNSRPKQNYMDDDDDDDDNSDDYDDNDDDDNNNNHKCLSTCRVDSQMANYRNSTTYQHVTGHIWNIQVANK